MKNIYILQNSDLSFDMDISKLYSPKYLLFLIVNNFGFQKLKSRGQEVYFERIWITEDFNYEYLKELISDNQKKYKGILQIVTNAEEAVLTCGILRTVFKTDSINYDRFKNKLLMKELIHKDGLLAAKYIHFDKIIFERQPLKYVNHITSMLTFPLIAKPVASMGSMGIQKINTKDELLTWCIKSLSINDDYEMEEFIEGKVYNCDSFIKDKKILFTQISECSNSCYDFICGLTKGTIALPHNDPIYQMLCEYTLAAHNAIGIPTAGVTHLEVILTKKKQLYFIEIGHRAPGILIPAMYKKYLNIDTIESHILLHINEDYVWNFKRGSYAAWIAFPRKKGRIVKAYTPDIQSHYQLEWYNHVGDMISDTISGRDYVGRLLLWNKDFQQLKKDFYYLNSFKFYDVEA